MRIGALDAYSFQPYVYNVNTVSAASMNKLSAISDDVLDKKVDYSGLVEENENPLKMGQTLDFQGMLERQIQQGRMKAERIMKPALEEEIVQAQTEAVTDEGNTAEAADEVSVQSREISGVVMSVDARTTDNADVADNAGMADAYSSYQMRQAIQAYEMMMTA